MDLEPTLFSSPMYETANEAVLYALSHLKAGGYATATASLNEAVVGRVMYQRLIALRPRVSSASRHYIDIALNALGRALGQQEARAVA